MSRASISIFCLILCFCGIAIGQQPDYLPLQAGNQWVYRIEPRGQPVVMEVIEARVFDDNTYYLTRNFLNSDTWLRTTEDLTLVSYDTETKQESVLVQFGAGEGSTYRTDIDPCNTSAKVISRSMKMRLPIGQFDNVLAIGYPPGFCADAGLGAEHYVPSIGLARRTRQTIAGPLTYDLSYARLGGVTMISAPEVTFSLTLDSAVYESSPVMARLTLRVVQPEPLRLNFRTSQEFDLAVKNEAGEIVYRWSDGRGFLEALHALNAGPGEKNYAVQFQLRDAQGNPLPAGIYTAEAWLTTEDPQRYRAQVAFESRPGK
jgi:hypothetical protein